MNKAPNAAQSENQPSWQLKRERPTVHKDSGPALTVSVNTSDPMPCLENNEENAVFQVGCVESASQGMTPLAQSHPVIAQTALPVLEDGKKSEPVESACVQSTHQEGIPGASANEVFRADPEQVLENVKMVKGLT